VWSFAVGKTPEVNPRSGFMTGTPGKPEFFAEQKMRPNEIVKKLLYLLVLCKEKHYTASIVLPPKRYQFKIYG
jgi:hypothetical protein